MKLKTIPLAALAAITIAIPAQAAVTFVGSLADDNSSQISAWSNTSTTKTLDLDANNYYGSDGYAWMNTDDSSGFPKAVLHSIAQSSAPAYFTSTIGYTGAGAGTSGSFVAADDRLLPNGTGSANVGYAGADYNETTGATVLQSLFGYTMSRDMNVGETIRLGVVLDSLNDTVIGADSLRLVAGSNFADATLVTGKRNGTMDMYFFDVTGLTSGEKIEIWGAKTADVSNFGYNAITISGVTLDSIPEPGATLLGGLGMLCLLRRRRA
jgi:MYXO-CTERM domain-containing protein